MSDARPIDVTLGDLVREMHGAGTFEEAATLALRPMLELAAAALSASPFAHTGKIVRALVHLRPDDGYRSLAVLEAGQGCDAAVARPQTRLSSASAWRWVAECAQPIAVDVNLGRVEVGDGHKRVLSARRFGDADSMSDESLVRLKERDVTHLYVVPLRGPRERVDGMISLEADCKAALARPFIWPACSEHLQLIADIAAPYLLNLPLEPVPQRALDPLLPVVGESMRSILELLRVFACQTDPILISGPTGAGKSRLARWCHAQSDANAHPFEILDLSAIPEELQLAELFGWRKGAFTGATRDNPGVIARARGGTLFIDEIDNLSARAQAGLLHVLEERKYRMLGDDGAERPAEVRFIIGTNARLQEAVRDKRFREDLYYRINVLPVKLPSLRDRPDEVALWASYMASRHHAKRTAGGHVALSERAQAVLLGHPWPGNLRQLDNIIRRAYAIAVVAHAGAPAPQDVLIDEDSVRRALAYDGSSEREVLIDALLAAAVAFVAEAEHRGPSAPLDLDLAQSFTGFVLGVATQKLAGNRDKAFRLLGREKLVSNRNHHKMLKRELEKVESLCVALGRRDQFPFERLGGDDPDDRAKGDAD
jgi:DNA-binding NtrC family response regulator